MRNDLVGFDFQSWHSFTYDAFNRIIVDTMHQGGHLSPDGEPLPIAGRDNPWVIYKFTYDAQSRIIKQTELWYGGDTAMAD